MGIAFVVAEEVVIIKCVEVEVKTSGETVAKAETTGKTGIETAVLSGEGAFLILRIEKDLIVRHEVSHTFDVLRKPVATESTSVKMAAQLGSTKREISHDGKHKIGVDMVGIDG